MNIDYIVVQAGGKGTRMDFLTRNKPKALVSVNNLPILFHLFRLYPDKKFIIIGDYKADVMERYLEAFAGDVDWKMVRCGGTTGTCSGISAALAEVRDGSPFMLVWSDLVMKKDYTDGLPDNCDYVGLSGDFRCRWKFRDGFFSEEPSEEYGVAGFFLFKDKSFAGDVPESGEFVRWLSSKDMHFDTVTLSGTKEYGLLSEYQKLKIAKCRPFNRIDEIDGRLVKQGIDDQGKALAVREKAWYKRVSELGFTSVPEIYSYEPLTMEKIDGCNIYDLRDISPDQKRAVTESIVRSLRELHSSGSCPADPESIYDAYIGKTFSRLDRIRSLVPFADQEIITINGRKCHNVFFFRDKLERAFAAADSDRFVPIHGDCTFSNIMVRRSSTEPVFIDPRGYFGKTEFYGDAAYDWAKLYYSIAGNYDMFNLKKFDLDISEDSVSLKIESSGWEEVGDHLLELVSEETSPDRIRLIHAVIWLSLTTYAWDDYDSVCGAFYNGTYLMEDCYESLL